MAEEDALRKLLTSDEDSDEEKKSGESEKDEQDAKNKREKQEQKEAKEARDKNKKKKLKKKAAKDDRKDSSSDVSSNTSESDEDASPNNGGSKKKKPSSSKAGAVSGQSGPSNNQNHSRSVSPVVGQDSSKRKINSMPTDLGISDNSNSPTATPAKRVKPDNSMPMTSSSSSMSMSMSSRDENGITEEAVRRYLMRKPMTTTELLTKFKNKKTGVSSEKLVETMTQILKKIDPVKQTIQGKMYLSIKTK